MLSVVQQRREKRARKELMARIRDEDKGEEPKVVNDHVGDGVYVGVDDHGHDEEEHQQVQEEGEKGPAGRGRKNGLSGGGVAQFIRGFHHQFHFHFSGTIHKRFSSALSL